jgi:hypothetical protein
MRSLLQIFSWPSAAILVLSLPGSPGAPPQAEGYRFQYAAKIVCASAESSAKLGLVPQAYTTTINVHNPSDSMAGIAKKVALTVPPGMEKPGKIIPLTKTPETLLPDQAMAVDCIDVMKRTGLTNQFDGFVVIYSTMPLDVVGVYAVPGGVDVVPAVERPRHLF